MRSRRNMQARSRSPNSTWTPIARTPGMYNVTGIPTLLVFKGGKLVETLVGFLPKDKLLAKVLPHLN